MTESARPVVDLNADMGEAFGVWPMGDDESLLNIVTSANIACGFHAGDPSTMRRTCAMAARRGVCVGAQVGYRDLIGFGRRFIDVAAEELTNDVLYQIAALDGIARAAEGTSVSYVKPHGALYNATMQHEDQAAAVVEAVRAFNPGLPVYGLPGSAWLRRAADAGLKPMAEAFADRAYTRNGTLVSRRVPHSVLHDPGVIAARAVRMAVEGTVEAEDNSVVHVAPRSICVHGDTRGAVAIARTVRRVLEAASAKIKPIG